MLSGPGLFYSNPNIIYINCISTGYIAPFQMPPTIICVCVFDACFFVCRKCTPTLRMVYSLKYIAFQKKNIELLLKLVKFLKQTIEYCFWTSRLWYLWEYCVCKNQEQDIFLVEVFFIPLALLLHYYFYGNVNFVFVIRFHIIF